MGGRAGEILAVYKILKFDIFNSKAHLGCLNGFIALIASYQYIDKWSVFERNIIVRLFFRYGKPYIRCQSLLSRVNNREENM